MINQNRIILFLILLLAGQGLKSQMIQVDTANIEVPGEGIEEKVIEWVLGTLHGGGGYFDDSTAAGIRYTGHPSAIGRYWNGHPNAGLDTGIIISNGRVSRAELPNNVGYVSDHFGTPSDENLDAFYQAIFDMQGINIKIDELEHDTTGDAAVLEFEYWPYGDTIYLEYIFASEEYQYKRPGDDTYSNFTGYTMSPDQLFDLFGISIDRGNAFDNLAKIFDPEQPPGPGNEPVDVNVYNINHNKISYFYRENGDGLANKFHTYDGQTLKHERFIIKKPVDFCTKYKVKIAIEDFWWVSPDEEQFSSGFQINSAVFLAGGSLSGGDGRPTWSATYDSTGVGANKSDFAGQIIEGCKDYLVTFKLDYPLPAHVDSFDIPFQINSTIFRDSLNITYEADGSLLPIDSVIFYTGEQEKTIRIAVGNIDIDHPNLPNQPTIKFSYPKHPCEKPRPPLATGVFSQVIEFAIRNNSPISISPATKYYDAYCKDYIDVSVVDETSGGVSPLKYLWNGQIPWEPIHTQQINNSPEVVNVEARDGCDNSETSIVQINNLPIIFDPIQSIFLCGPGQEATVPVTTFKPDSPDYSITNVEWWRSDPPPILPIDNKPGDQITVEYDSFVGDAIWTCEYLVTDICGATSAAVPVDFEVNQSSLTLNNQGICLGDQVELYTGTPAHWYKWYKMIPPNDSVLILADNPAIDNPTSTSIYKLWIEDNCGEVQAATMTVYVDDYTPQISLVPADGEICNGESVDLLASAYAGLEGNVTYEWFNGLTDKDITVSHGEYTIGQNTFYLTTIHDYLPFYICDNNASTQFTVFSNPSPMFSMDPAENACTSTDVQFDYLSDTTTNRTFDWDFGDGDSDNQPHTTHQYSSPGTYDVNLFVEQTYAPNSHTCSSEITNQLTVDPLPEPNFTASPIEGCIPVLVDFNDNSQEILPGATYEWSFGDGGTESSSNPSHEYTEAGLFTVNLLVHNTERCFASISKSNYIQVNPNPTAGFEPDPWITTMDTPLIEFINLSTSDSTLIGYEWDFGDGDTSDEENPSHTFQDPGEYEITLRIETINGCWDTTLAVVALTEYVQLFIPTAFTPNGDGLNDVFQVKGTPMADYNLYIYNRWGQQVWSTHNYEISWNGEDKFGNPVESGSYIYKIQGTDYQKTPVLYEGTVNVVR